MDWFDYREKLGIGFNDQEKVKYFRIRLFNLLDTDSNDVINQITGFELFKFCDITGTDFHKVNSSYNNYPYNIIIDVIKKNGKSLEELLAYCVAFINCQEDSENKKYKKEVYLDIIIGLLSSSHIQYELITDKDGVFIFPKGVEMFDKALVSEPLQWIFAYPKAEKAWSKALREYANQNDQNASDIADLFRKSLETFFQEFFEKDGKVIKNFISDYGEYLKNKGIPSEIRNNFKLLLDGYDHYMGSYAKHRDATSDKVLEYLLYETGNIIRLLIMLDKYPDAPVSDKK